MKTELDEILTPSKPMFRQVVSPGKIRSLQLLAAHTQRLFDTFGIRVSPKGQSKMIERIMKTGKNRVYRRRPQLVDPVTGYRQTYGDRRKMLIEDSQRQGVELANELRLRRHARHLTAIIEPKTVTGSAPSIKTEFTPNA